MTIEKKTEIETGLVKLLTADPARTATVAEYAWAFREHPNNITPIFNKLVASGTIKVAYQSVAGNKVYESA